MKLNEFQELSKRTMPYNGVPANQAEFENMLGNYAMGLVGESTELLNEIRHGEYEEGHQESVLKEMGDVMHYVVGLGEILKIELHTFDLPDEIRAPYQDNVTDMTIRTGIVVEVIKKHLYHRHELNLKKIRANLLSAIRNLQRAAEFYGYSMTDIFLANINKLKERYPESFNTADSINRVDVASNK